MEELRDKKRRKPLSINRKTMKWIAYLLLFLYCYSRIVIQNGMMHISTLNGQGVSSLAQALTNNNELMSLANKAVLYEFIGYLAIPMFAYLLVDGYLYTSNYKKYVTRCFLLAVVCEPLYDLATHTSLVNFTSQNPVLSICIALIMIKGMDMVQKKWAYPFIVIAAILWAVLLKTSFGLGIVLLSGVYWIFRKNKTIRLLVGCGISSIFYTAPLASLLLWLSKGEEENQKNTKYFYLVYPFILIICIGITYFI